MRLLSLLPGLFFTFHFWCLLRRKIKRSVTDSEGIIRYCDEQPGIKNLIDIYTQLGNKTVEEEMNKEVEKAKKEAVKKGVEFIYPDQEPFKKACEPMYNKLFSENKDIKKIYDKIKSQNFVVEN